MLLGSMSFVFGMDPDTNFCDSLELTDEFSSTIIFNTLSENIEKSRNDIHLNLCIKNASSKNQQLYLSFINPTVDKILVKETGKKTQLLGDFESFRKRVFKHVNPVYPFYLKKDSTTQIKLIIYNHKTHPLNISVKLAEENVFIKTTNQDNFFNGIYYGIFFLYLMLLICFYIFSKSNFFFIYMTINIFSLLLIMLYNGTGNQYLWFYSSKIQQYISIIAAIGYLTAHILFIRTFFSVQIKNLSKYFFRIFFTILVISGFLLIFQFYNVFPNRIFSLFYPFIVQGVFVIYGFLVILLCLYSYSETKSREAIWVLTGVIFHLINWVIFINNEYVSIHFLNKLNTFKLFNSDIFVPHLNYLISLAEIFVVTVFIAINYHKLIRQNSLSSQRIEFLQKRNINTFVLGLEEERSKITDEIRADISKDISSLQQRLKSIQINNDDKNILPTVIAEIDKTLTDIDNITGNYVAPDLERMKFKELIQTATDKLNQKFSTDYNFVAIPDNLQLNAVANINLYRIFQEISNNAIKHSKAKNISITAIIDTNSLQIKIKDDGVGFGDIFNNKGIGLMNIESRMNSLNGSFYLLSNEKTGTTIHLIMSLKDII